jgi:hypothetical protein
LECQDSDSLPSWDFRLENKIIPSFFLKHAGWRVIFSSAFWDATANHHSWFIEAYRGKLQELSIWLNSNDVTTTLPKISNHYGWGEVIPKNFISGWWMIIIWGWLVPIVNQ